MWLRLKPDAIFWSWVALGSRSPAICSMVNSSYGMFWLKALITQSRHGHMSRWSRCGSRAYRSSAPNRARASPCARRNAGKPEARPRAFIGVGGTVGKKGVEFRGRGRQARQIEINPAQKRGFIRFGRRLQPFRVKPRQNKIVDRIADPRRFFHRRWRESLGATKDQSISHFAPWSIHSLISSICCGVSLIPHWAGACGGLSGL